MKNKVFIISWIMLFLLAGGLFLGGGYLSSEVQGIAFLFLCALIFISITIRSKKHWWAIIPGGIFVSLGSVAVLEALIPQEDYSSLQNTIRWGVYTWVLFMGLAATFGVLWLLRKTQSTDWAKYPAVGLLATSVMAFILGSRFQQSWMITLMVAIGVMLVLALFTRHHRSATQQASHFRT